MDCIIDIYDTIPCEKCFNDIVIDKYMEHVTICTNNQQKINAIPLTDEQKIDVIHLTDIQKKAFKYCKKKSKAYCKSTKYNIEARFSELGYEKEDLMRVIQYMKNVDLIVHFSEKLVPYLLNSTHYKNTFEVSNYKGTGFDARISWEDRLFGKIYTDKCEPSERVKYGALNMFSSEKGCDTASNCYGKSYMILKQNVRKRISFVNGDSSGNQIHICTMKYFSHILLYVQVQMIHDLVKLSKYRETNPNDRYMDINVPYTYQYIEMQIHGDLIFERDVELFMFCRGDIDDETINIFKERSIPFEIF